MEAVRLIAMRVLCSLPNMSAQVSGVGFTPAPDGAGWVSDDLTPALAHAFAEIPGYILLADPLAPSPVLEPVDPPAPEPAQSSKKGKL